MSLVHDGCFDRWPEDKCYIYDYNIDFEQTATMFQILDNIARNRDYDTTCIQEVRTFLCNYVYPKCDPVTGNYQGICTQDCIDIVLNETCNREFGDLEFFASTTDVLTFSRQCNNTLIFLEQFMPDFVYNPDDCFNISGKPWYFASICEPTLLLLALLTTYIIMVYIVVLSLCRYCTKCHKFRYIRTSNHGSNSNCQSGNNTYFLWCRCFVNTCCSTPADVHFHEDKTQKGYAALIVSDEKS